jgi:LysM repeat protein
MTTRRLVVTLIAVALMLTALANVAVAAPQNAPQAGYSCVAYYTVQAGDNLYRISLKYNVSMAALMAANGITNPDFVYAGQTLCIPSSVSVPPAPPPPPPPPPGNVPPPANCGTYYTVRWGDTLSNIAYRYGTTMQAIMYANHMTNPNFIYAGMILYIPCGTKPPAPAPAPVYSQWKGEYFNNPNLAGAPSVVRNDQAIAFNWGLGWPSPKISADNFSVRWTRTVYLNEGTYRFTVNVDDGARLFVDNILVIDQWQSYTGQTYTADVPLGAGNHVIRMEYFEGVGNAFAYLTYQNVTGQVPTQPIVTPIPGQPPIPPTPSGYPSGSAWTCTYFGNQDLDDSVATVILPDLLLNWSGNSPYPGVPKNLWSMRCTSVQYMPSNGLYQFNAQVDDGVRLFVDGNAVINAWSNHAGTTQVGTANLNAGPHNVTVEYYQFGHDSMLSVWWNKK